MINVKESRNEYAANLKVARKKDVVVVGGGPAGCAAALSARRNGADTLLIERESYLGGMMTGGGAGGIAINGYRAGSAGHPVVVRGIAMEMFKRLQEARGALPGETIYPRQITDPAILVHLLDEMMVESNVEVLFNTIAFDAVVDNNTIKGVAIANKSGGQIILAERVVDASADGDISGYAGAPFVFGRLEDGRYHGGSLDMLIGGIDADRLIDYLKHQPNLTEEERKRLEDDRSRLLGAGRSPDTALDREGKPRLHEPKTKATNWDEVEKARRLGEPLPIRLCTGGGGPIPGKSSAPIKDGKYVPLPAGLDQEWIDYIKKGEVPPLLGAAGLIYPPPRFEPIGVLRFGKRRYDQMYSGVYEVWFKTISEEETSQALIYMRKLNKTYIKFLRERVPGFENAYIVMESTTAGTREGRRIIGEYSLTENDLWEGRRFPDVIAKGGTRGPDIHAVGGVWGTGVVTELFRPYDIPYRCLIPQKIDNLLAAGRSVSATTLASGAVRSQAPAMAIGEAAGAAAAISLRSGVAPRNIDIRQLQKTLLQQGALLFMEDEKEKEQEILSYPGK
jgi:hypothetical protein